MAQLRAITHATDSTIGGFLITFPSGVSEEVIWKSFPPVPDTLAASKETVTQLLDGLLQAGRIDDAERTNWASVTAAVQKLFIDFNERRRSSLYSSPQSVLPS